MKYLLYTIGLIIPLGITAQENGEIKNLQVINISRSTSTSYGRSVASYSENKIIAGSVNGTNNGEVFIHTLNTNGTIQSSVRITRNVGGFGDHAISGHHFGAAVVNVGDINGDGIDDLVVGAPNSNSSRGSIWFLFLDINGEVIGERRLSDTTTGFGTIGNGNLFGSCITNLGDIDRNGYDDIAVSAPQQNASSTVNGSVYIILLEKDGKVKSSSRINDNNNLFGRTQRHFGYGIANVGDIDGDGNTDLAEGEAGYTGSRGAVWIFLLNNNGTLKGVQEIGKDKGGFTDSFNASSNFGWSIKNLRDIDGDGVNDIAVGELGFNYPDSTGSLYGRVWVLLLNTNGTVKKNIMIGNGKGGFTGNIKMR